MYVSFGYQKLDNGRVKLHTLAYRHTVEKLAQLAYLNKFGIKIDRVLNLGIATKAQKEWLDAYEEPELEA